MHGPSGPSGPSGTTHTFNRDTKKAHDPRTERAQSRGRVVYISYKGLCEPLGRTQVASYVAGLARRGWRMVVMSFEKPSATEADRAEVRSWLAASGAEWIPLAYHKKPTVPATLFDVGSGIVSGLRERVRGPIALIHANSYIGGSIGLPLKRVTGAPMLFDMRGFWADERIEGGSWTQGGAVYRAAKELEQKLFSSADAVVSLTEAGRRILLGWPIVGGRGVDIKVIPTCADLSSFESASEVIRRGPLTLGYLGSLGGRYLIDPTVELFRAVRAIRPDARLHVLTPLDQAPLWNACARHGVPREAVRAERVPPSEVPAKLASMHATISLIQPGFSSLASCPTKFGESLAAGVPVVVNDGIGDCGEIVRTRKVGVVTGLNGAALSAAAPALLALLDEGRPLAARCLTTARDLFDLGVAIDRYHEVYLDLLAPETSA